MSWVSAALPEGSRRVTYDVAGGPLAGVELAPAQPRGTVLLVPGYSGSKEDFGPLLAPLAAAGWRAVALDLRGQHESPGPDDEAAYTVDALAAHVLEVVRVHGRVHLVGHSFGGLVSRAVALADRSGLASLTLLGSGPAALTGPRVDVLAFLPDVLASGGLEAIADASEALSAADPEAADVPPEVTAFLRQRWLTSAPAGLLGMAEALRSEPDRVEALRATGVPVLVLHGQDDDAWLPPVQADMAVRLGADLVVVPGARHSPAAENPDATASALDLFWTSTLGLPPGV